MISNNDILTMKEAAAYLNMGYETFRYYLTKSRGPEFIPKNKKTRLFTPEALEEWKATRRRKAKDTINPKKGKTK